MPSTSVPLIHTTAADAALDNHNGTPPAGAILAAQYNENHTISDLAAFMAELSTFTPTAKGLAPAPGTTDSQHFLCDDGTYRIPTGTGGGTSDGVFQTMDWGPFIAPPDIGPGVIDAWNPWTAAGGTTGDHAVIAISTSVNGATLNGLIPTRTGDIAIFLVGGDGKGPLTFGHMAAAVAVNKIYCPNNVNAQLYNGGAAILYCLNQSDHGWRVIAAWPGATPMLGAPLAVTIASGTQIDNWNPTGAASSRRWHVTVPTAGATISGISQAPDGLNFFKPGELLTLVNYGDGANNLTATLTLKDFTGSSAGNKILCPAGGVIGSGANDITLKLYESITLMRDEFPSEPGIWMVYGRG